MGRLSSLYFKAAPRAKEEAPLPLYNPPFFCFRGGVSEMDLDNVSVEVHVQVSVVHIGVSFLQLP